MCGGSGNYLHNCPKNKLEGPGDGATDSEKNYAVQDTVILKYDDKPISQRADDGVPDDNNNKKSRETEIQGNPSEQND